MELCEKIKVMQHFEDGGEIEFSGDNFKTVLGEANKKDDNDLGWNWEDFEYRIKEEKQKVTIEKWLCKDISNGEYFIYESDKIDLYIKEAITSEKVKLIKSYEMEL